MSVQDFTALAHMPALQRLEMFHDCPSHLDNLPPEGLDIDQQLDAAEAAEVRPGVCRTVRRYSDCFVYMRSCVLV